MSGANIYQALLAFNTARSISGPENFFRHSIHNNKMIVNIPTRTTALLLIVSIIHRNTGEVLIH